MTVLLYDITANYPKNERFVLASRTTDAALALGTSLSLAVPSTIPRVRLGHLEDADKALATIKLLARIAVRRGCLPIKRYEQIAVHVVEIGKMLGGWLRQTARALGPV